MTKPIVTILLLLLACHTLAQNSPLEQGLLKFGIDAVMQLTLFGGSNSNLDTNLYKVISQSLTRAPKGQSTYDYWCQVTLKSSNNRYTVSIAFDITLNTSTGKFDILYQPGQVAISDADFSGVDGPQYEDANKFKTNPIVQKGINFAVAGATKAGQMKQDSYSLTWLVSVSDEGVAFPMVYNLLVELTGSQGNVYRVLIRETEDLSVITYTVYPNSDASTASVATTSSPTQPTTTSTPTTATTSSSSCTVSFTGAVVPGEISSYALSDVITSSHAFQISDLSTAGDNTVSQGTPNDNLGDITYSGNGCVNVQFAFWSDVNLQGQKWVLSVQNNNGVLSLPSSVRDNASSLLFSYKS